MYRERAGRVRWGGGAMRTIHDAKQESTRALLGATALSPLFLSLGVSVVFAEETETVVIHITRSLVSPPHMRRLRFFNGWFMFGRARVVDD